MRIYLISDNVDTLTGMRLAGVLGTVVHEREALSACLSELLREENAEAQEEPIGIVLVTEKVYDLAPDLIDPIKQSRKFPLIVVIPDRHGSSRGENSITAFVKETIGI